MHVVGFGLSNLRLDIARGRNTSRALVAYNADLSQVKIYCRARNN